jgi:hypothetical protein
VVYHGWNVSFAIGPKLQGIFSSKDPKQDMILALVELIAMELHPKTQ